MDLRPEDIEGDSVSGRCGVSLLNMMLIGVCLVSCSSKYPPEEAVRIAQTYTELQWMPAKWHIRHGNDSKSIIVQTPDITLVDATGDKRGWWKPGKMAKGMAYKWGGFDTPETFITGLRQGKRAGDVANSYKVRNDNAAISDESVGVDCSGFISRCWGLDRHYDTRDLPGICDPIAWDDLRMGDIILKSGHVLMFMIRQDEFIVGYEAGPIPTWRARRSAIRISYLTEKGYSPYRYRKMDIPCPKTNIPHYDIDFTGAGWTSGSY